MARTATKPRRAKRTWKVLGWGTVLWSLCGGFSAMPHAGPPKHQSAWLEAKSACLFPLGSEGFPATSDLLNAALNDGLRRMSAPPINAQLVKTEAGNYPMMHSLSIDLSNASEDSDHKPPKLDKHVASKGSVLTDKFAVSAEPLLIHGAKIKYEFSADGARLDVRQDNKGHPLLMLVAAREGEMGITVSADDIQTLCQAGGREIGKKYGFKVDKVHVDLATPDPRTLKVDVAVTLDGALGGNLWLSGQFDIADDLTATASHLSCRGDGPAGLVISALLIPGLALYDGKTKPLLEFPDERMQLKDVRVKMDDALHINASFGDVAGQ